MKSIWFVVCASAVVFTACPPDEPARGCRTNGDCYRNEYCSAGCVCSPAPTGTPSECVVITEDAGTDGGRPDETDAGTGDDGGPGDGGAVDGGVVTPDDGGLSDGGVDAGRMDGGLDAGVDGGSGRVDAGVDAGPQDAGRDAGPDAGTPDAGPSCNPTSCPTGCCLFGTCTPMGPGSCGAPGTSCQSCGTGESCVAGQCVCGTTGACAPGQRCSNSQCVCDQASCPAGCCSSDGGCQPGLATTACGIGGLACSNCAGTLTDRCVQSTVNPNYRGCACGPGQPPSTCTTGFFCAYGSCSRCAIASCTDGCCDSNVCRLRVNYSNNACGRSALPGAPCIRCITGSSCNLTVGDCQWPDGGLAPAQPPPVNGGAQLPDGGWLCSPSCGAGRCCNISSTFLPQCSDAGTPCGTIGTVCQADGICR